MLCVLLVVACNTNPLVDVTDQAVATVDTGFSGSEQLFVRKDSDQSVLCQFSWTMAASGVRDDCPDCDFAFDVALTGGTRVAGDCATSAPAPTRQASYGFASSWPVDSGAPAWTSWWCTT